MLEWLESSNLAAFIRSSGLLYPIIEIIHIVGFVILVGAAFMFDLRLLGLSKKLSITDLAKHLLPWSRRSLVLVIPSGILLFIANATSVGSNPVFYLKLFLILAAFINAAVFHRFSYPSAKDRFSSSISYKVTAILSILFWIGVLSCGRFLAYL
ncbi:MAG TPA: DUF6644 family protein [Cytophagales bacterium]|nr:DUF6644 family protein [Cytophagales bacterium]